MKVFTLATRFGVGGAELNSQLLTERLNSSYSCSTKSVFLMYANGDLPDNENCICLLPSETKNPILLLIAFIRLLKIIYKEQPDVLVGFQPLANIFGSVSVLFTKAKFIGSQRNPSFSQSKMIGYLEKLLGSTRLYSANIAVTNAVINSYSHYPASYLKKLVCIYNGFPQRPKKTDKTQARTLLRLPTDKKIVGFLGRFAYQKQPEFLLDVFSELAMKNTLLVYAGEGAEFANLKKRVTELGLTEQVLFIGQLEFERVFNFYDAIDIFVLPSRFEGFGRTLVEAMQSNIPVIANDLEVTREVLSNNEFVIRLDAKLWADRIRTLFTNPIIYDEACNYGMKRALFFNIENMINGYYKLINESLED